MIFLKTGILGIGPQGVKDEIGDGVGADDDDDADDGVLEDRFRFVYLISLALGGHPEKPGVKHEDDEDGAEEGEQKVNEAADHRRQIIGRALVILGHAGGSVELLHDSGAGIIGRHLLYAERKYVQDD